MCSLPCGGHAATAGCSREELAGPRAIAAAGPRRPHGPLEKVPSWFCTDYHKPCGLNPRSFSRGSGSWNRESGYGRAGPSEDMRHDLPQAPVPASAASLVSWACGTATLSLHVLFPCHSLRGLMRVRIPVIPGLGPTRVLRDRISTNDASLALFPSKATF